MSVAFIPRPLLNPLKRLCRWICRDEVWNAEMSKEIDRLVAENEQQRERITELKWSGRSGF